MARPFDPRFDILYSDEVARAGDDPRRLRRLSAAGHLHRIRRGAYILAERWEGADQRQRHLAHVYAAAHDARGEFIVAGISAASVWGVPTFRELGATVEVLERYRGGGRSEPGVRRLTAAAEHASAIMRDGLQVTDLPRTVIDAACGRPLPEALAVVDWAISRSNPDATATWIIRDRLSEMGKRAGVRQVWRAAELAVTDSGSAGESFARGVVHELGFPAPVTQLEVADDIGAMYPDFAWPEYRVLAEFDGFVKYADPRYNHGDPLEKVRRERSREARLRALGWTIVRITWADLQDPPRVARLLYAVGVPRRGI